VAWTSSIEHIRSTPGFADRDWPREDMTLEENTADLVGHDNDFAARRGFTYTVLRSTDDLVVGCVYIYPARASAYDAEVRSWVRGSEAALDSVLYRLVADWIKNSWPFRRPYYAARP
jgi:hypothetical protein